jgi:transposase-like protein
MGAPRKEYTEAIAMYKSGLSIQDIANFYQITRQSMHKWFNRRGVDMRPNIRTGDNNRFYRGGKTQDDRARTIYRNAIKKGILVNPKVCSECGSLKYVSGHHDDYNKPLHVRWLCHSCHFTWHQLNKALPAIDLPPKMDHKEICRMGGLKAQENKRNEKAKSLLQ